MATVPYEAGAGRGRLGGPTAEELKDYDERGVWSARKAARGDYGTEGKTMAPRDLTPEDFAKMQAKPKAKKLAKGGYTRAADGCCQRGKTRGKMV